MCNGIGGKRLSFTELPKDTSHIRFVNQPIISLRDDMEFAAHSLLSPFCDSSRWQRWSSMRLLWNLLRRSKKQSSSEGSRPSFWNKNNKSLFFFLLSTKTICVISSTPVMCLLMHQLPRDHLQKTEYFLLEIQLFMRKCSQLLVSGSFRPLVLICEIIFSFKLFFFYRFLFCFFLKRYDIIVG